MGPTSKEKGVEGKRRDVGMGGKGADERDGVYGKRFASLALRDGRPWLSHVRTGS